MEGAHPGFSTRHTHSSVDYKLCSLRGQYGCIIARSQPFEGSLY